MKTQKAVSTVSTPAKKQAVALKDLKTKKDPKGGSQSKGSFAVSGKSDS
jgi:hypothetical protein